MLLLGIVEQILLLNRLRFNKTTTREHRIGILHISVFRQQDSESLVCKLKDMSACKAIAIVIFHKFLARKIVLAIFDSLEYLALHKKCFIGPVVITRTNIVFAIQHNALTSNKHSKEFRKLKIELHDFGRESKMLSILDESHDFVSHCIISDIPVTLSIDYV